MSESIEVSRLIADELSKQDHVRARLVTEYIESTNIFVKRISDSVSTAKKIFLLEKYYPYQVDRFTYMFSSAIRFLESVDKSFIEIVLDVFDKIPIRETPYQDTLSRYMYELFDGKAHNINKRAVVDILSNLPSKYIPAKSVRSNVRVSSKKIFFSYAFIGEIIFLVLNRLIASHGVRNIAKLLDKYRKPYGEIPSYLTSMLLDVLLRYREGHGKLISIESFVGGGKTTYTFFSIANALKILMKNYEDKEIEELTEKLFVSDIESFIQLVDEALAKNVKIPLLVVDDTSIWLHPYWSWSSGEEKKLFMKLRDQLISSRKIFGALILVTNNPKDLSSFVRRLIEERVVGETSRVIMLMTTTLFYHESKSSDAPVDVFIFPLLRLPEAYYLKDQRRKEEILRKRQEEIKEIVREKKYSLALENTLSQYSILRT